MKQILIYGDSLVFGKKPGVPERYAPHERFVGAMADVLGPEYTVIAEGLRARNLCGENPFFPERDGLAQFGPIYGSHVPIDMCIIMLGTNDCNLSPRKSKSDIYTALNAYVEKIHSWNTQLGITQMPHILFVAPPYIHGNEVAKNSAMSKIFGSDAEERSKEIHNFIIEFATEYGYMYFDAAQVVSPAEGEGIHLGLEQNQILGKALAEKIRTISA